MNIGDGQPVGGLFERIENAYEGSKLDEIQAGPEGTQEVGAAGRSTGLDPKALDQASPSAPRWEQVENSIQHKLLELCSDIIEGRFSGEDEEAVRNRVVETIVEQRYGRGLSPKQTKPVLAALRLTLNTDPGFREDVEHLLVLAARELR